MKKYKNTKIQNYNFDKICIMGMLGRADIIPTKQRVAIASLMFDKKKILYCRKYI